MAAEILRAGRDRLELICDCEGVTAAEIRHCVRHEWVTDLVDLERRSHCGRGPCLGVRCALRAGQIVAEELGLSPAKLRAMLEDYTQHRWRAAAPVAAGSTLAKLEMMRALQAVEGPDR